MSRPPGHLSTAIVEHLAAHPDQKFTIGELAAIAYPGVAIEKKHRVATGRAARKLAPERLKYREPPTYTPDPAVERRFDVLRRALERIWISGDVATIIFTRDELGRMYNRFRRSITANRARILKKHPEYKSLL